MNINLSQEEIELLRELLGEIEASGPVTGVLDKLGLEWRPSIHLRRPNEG